MLLGETLDLNLISKLVLSLIVTATPAYAFRDPMMGGDDAGAIAVYSFDENGGMSAFDSSSSAISGNPLDLIMSNAGNLSSTTPIRTNASLQTGYLLVNPKPNGAPDSPAQGYEAAQRHRTFLVSTNPAAK